MKQYLNYQTWNQLFIRFLEFSKSSDLLKIYKKKIENILIIVTFRNFQNIFLVTNIWLWVFGILPNRFLRNIKRLNVHCILVLIVLRCVIWMYNTKLYYYQSSFYRGKLRNYLKKVVFSAFFAFYNLYCKVLLTCLRWVTQLESILSLILAPLCHSLVQFVISFWTLIW